MRYTLIAILAMSTMSVNGQVNEFLNVPYHYIDSVDQNLLSFDAYVPQVAGPKPIIIYVHGGGWVSGDKSVFGEKMKLFTDMGYIFMSINYRLSPYPYELDNPDRVKYPQHPDDVARAIGAILDNATINGGDLEKVAIIGHSAGAQIVSLIMTDESFLETYGHSPEEIKCLCSLDTGGYDINLWLGSASDSTILLYTNAFSADSIIRRQASPAHNVNEMDNLPSTLLVHQNTAKRIYINGLFSDTLSSYGGEVIVMSSTYDHGEINQMIGNFESDTSTLYTQEITNWFEECLSPVVSVPESEIPDFKIFPNPASDIVYLSENVGYQLLDLQGRVVAKGIGRFIDVSNITSGNYLLSLQLEEGEVNEMIMIE